MHAILTHFRQYFPYSDIRVSTRQKLICIPIILLFGLGALWYMHCAGT